MLVLTRRVGESLMIGDDIVVTIVGLDSSGLVRVGVKAPRHVSVYREEIQQSSVDPAGGREGTDAPQDDGPD